MSAEEITLQNLTNHYGHKTSRGSPLVKTPLIPLNRVWIYARTSFDPRHEERSCDTQVDICRTYASQFVWRDKDGNDVRGLPIGTEVMYRGQPFSTIVKETDLTARIPPKKRPLCGVMYKLLEPGDHIIITRLNRVWRNGNNFREEWEDFQTRGISIHSIRDYNGLVSANNPFMWLMINMKALYDEFERAEIAERTLEMHARKKSRGERVSHSPGLGRKFEKHPNRNIWYPVVNIAELQLIDQMLKFKDAGHTYTAIWKHITKHGAMRQRVTGKKGAERDHRGRVNRSDLRCVDVPWSLMLVKQAIILANKMRQAGRTMEDLANDKQPEEVSHGQADEQ